MAYDPQKEMDEFENRDKSIQGEMDRFEVSQPPAPTKEDGSLGQIYKGMGHLQYLAKPAAFVATPILEAARAPFKYIAENVGENTSQTPPINTGAEYESFKPSDRATTSNLLTDVANSVGIKSQPLMHVESKDYPKAANVANQMSNPYNLSGLALDTALASKIPDVVAPTIDTASMAKNYIMAKSKDRELLQKLQESGKLDDIASYVSEHPKEYIRPFSSNKTLDHIEGPAVTTADAQGVSSTKRDLSKGKLGGLLEQQNQAIEDLPRDQYDISKHELAMSAKAELAKKGLLPTQTSAAEKMIDDIINVTQPSSSKISLIRKVEGTGSEINDLSKQISDEAINQMMGLGQKKADVMGKIRDVPEEINNPEYAPGVKATEPQSIPNPQHKIIMDDIQTKMDAIDQQIKDLNEGKVPAGKNFSNYSKLKKQKAALEKFYSENYDESAPDINAYMDLIDKQNLRPVGYSSDIRRQGNQLMSAVGNETPQEMGSAQAAGSALETAGRNAQEQVMGMAPQISKDMFDIRNKEIATNINVRDLLNKQRTSPQNKLSVPVGEPVRGVSRELMSLYPEYAAPYVKRAQQSTLNTGARGMDAIKYSLPMQLVKFQIPRNSNEIMANKDAVIAKIAQMSNNPEIVDMLKDAVIDHPEKLPKVLPALILKYPDLFEPDDYNRVDGKIFDPQLKQKALNDLQNNKTMSLKDRAFKAKRLQQEGILE